MFLLHQLYCCQYQFDIDTISFCDCWIRCIAVDIVHIDTISFCACWISCIAVDIVHIDMISFCACWISCIAVNIDTILSCSFWIKSVSTIWHSKLISSRLHRYHNVQFLLNFIWSAFPINPLDFALLHTDFRI